MLEAFVGGLLHLFTPSTFGYMMIGISIGFLIGILPGLGGVVTLALMLPFTYHMDPFQAFAFLLGMGSVTATTGDITSILFGIPGESSSTATIVDGFPMTKRGEAGRALGASLMSSLIGAIIGAISLALAIPIVRPLVLSLGAPEFFMLCMMGIMFIAILSGSNILKGIIVGLFGLLLATIGTSLTTGIPRYTFGLLPLADGIEIVSITIGLFAIPEIIDMAVNQSSIAKQISKIGGAWEGVKDTFRHLGITIRCSLIGTFIGFLPGLGGPIAQWLAYGHAVQSSKDRDNFGKGDVRGVIGPSAANNSKEGGALVPTLAFGIPGSLFFAVLLGAFLIQGLDPGPQMLTTHLDLTFSMMWLIVLSNIIVVPICFLFINQIVKITFVRGTLLIPLILVLIFLGGFTARNELFDLNVILIMGVIGWIMVKLDWPRPPLAIGLVLGTLAENYLFISVNRYGINMFSHPGVLIILLMILAALFWPAISKKIINRLPRRDLNG